MSEKNCKYCGEPTQPRHNQFCPASPEMIGNREESLSNWKRGFKDAQEGIGSAYGEAAYVMGYSQGSKEKEAHTCA